MHIERLAPAMTFSKQSYQPEADRSDPRDRREYRRAAVELPGTVFVPGTSQEAPCRITNISPAGAEIACAIENLLDTPIVLYTTAFGRFDGDVVWQFNGRYGIKFSLSELKQARLASQLSYRETSATSAQHELRRAERTKANRLTTLTREDGTTISCIIVDFSTSGVQVQTNVRPPVGEPVRVGDVAGRVIRYSETGLGIQFIEQQRDDERLKDARESIDKWKTGGRQPV